MEVCAVYYLMLIKGSEVLKGLAVNTTNRKSPGRPPPPSTTCSEEMLFNIIKTTLRVRRQHFFKKAN